MWDQLMAQLDPRVLQRVTILLCTLRGWTRDSRRTALWQHLNVDQPSVAFLADRTLHDLIDRFVFVSHWQAQRFEDAFATPADRTVVLRNAIHPFEEHEKPRTGPIKVLYASTPWRGLDILLAGWELLRPPNAELHVYSSCKLYGRRFGANDSRFEHLYRKARELDGVRYHGIVPNEQLRGELLTAHVYAYPSTFEETSCISVIEAMSAGCHVVTNDLGALPETCAGFAHMYRFTSDSDRHTSDFAAELSRALDLAQSTPARTAQVAHFRDNYSWQSRLPEWADMLDGLTRDGGVVPAVSQAIVGDKQ
jgi:glycosyltransferase involved in cell wall biosynthesis